MGSALVSFNNCSGKTGIFVLFHENKVIIILDCQCWSNNLWFDEKLSSETSFSEPLSDNFIVFGMPVLFGADAGLG